MMASNASYIIYTHLVTYETPLYKAYKFTLNQYISDIVVPNILSEFWVVLI